MEVGHAVSKRFDVQLSRAECLIDGCRHLGHLCEVATTNTAVQIEDLPYAVPGHEEHAPPEVLVRR